MCNCGGKGGAKKAAQRAERWTVKLPNGLDVTKSSEIQARNYAAKHPGATVKKAGE